MFGIADYGAFCAATLLFLALPGPVTFALLSATGKGGFRAGAAATSGLIIGDQVLLWLPMAGVAALLAVHPAWFKPVQYLGLAYLGWIGLRMLLAQGEASSATIRIVSHHYLRQALLITLLNPKAIVSCMAFVPLFIDPATRQGPSTFGAMALTFAVLTALCCLRLCALATAMSRHLCAQQRLARGLQRVTGMCLVGFGLQLVRD